MKYLPTYTDNVIVSIILYRFLFPVVLLVLYYEIPNDLFSFKAPILIQLLITLMFYLFLV